MSLNLFCLKQENCGTLIASFSIFYYFAQLLFADFLKTVATGGGMLGVLFSFPITIVTLDLKAVCYEVYENRSRIVLRHSIPSIKCIRV